MLWFIQRDALYLILALAGIAFEFTGAWLHDRDHRHRGQSPHSLWGLDDRHRPNWIPGRR